MGVTEGGFRYIDVDVIILGNCVASHNIQRIDCQPEKNYFFRRWPIPLVVCWTGKKKKKEESGSVPPAPPTLLVRRKSKSKSRDASTYICMSRCYASRRYAGLGPSRVSSRIPTTRRLGQ